MKKGFFSWLDLRNLFDIYQEWHAFAEGFCEVLCPWPARYEPSEELVNELRSEHHYYVFGRASGVIAWLIIALIIKEVLF